MTAKNNKYLHRYTSSSVDSIFGGFSKQTEIRRSRFHLIPKSHRKKIILRRPDIEHLYNTLELCRGLQPIDSKCAQICIQKTMPLDFIVIHVSYCLVTC